MAIILKILNENRGWSEVMTLGDISNNQHAFTWNEQFGAYCYEPKTQQECDDIIATNFAYAKVIWKVGVIFDGPSLSGGASTASPSAVATMRIPPYVKPELYDTYPIEDLRLLCLDSNFVAEGNQNDPTNIKIQLHRYYEGRAWAAEEVKRMLAKIGQLERELGAATAKLAQETAKVVASPAPADEKTVAPPAPRKRGRPAKVRELQPA